MENHQAERMITVLLRIAKALENPKDALDPDLYRRQIEVQEGHLELQKKEFILREAEFKMHHEGPGGSSH